jgi:dipeptidyl aminopeptidase/acylaminoacyl peptidase
MNPWVRRNFSLCALLVLALPTFAKKKEDPLERKTPVSADQTIPVIDFFRPRLFTNPELNPAGTHFAAIMSTKDDRTDLITYDLATTKTERLNGTSDFDIVNYEWLNDRRLVFSVVRDKLYAAGLFAAELGKFSQMYALQRHNVIVPVGFPKERPTEMIIWIRQSAAEQGADGGVFKIDTHKSINGGDRDGILYVNGSDDGLRADVIASYPSPVGGAAIAYLADRRGELAFAFTSKDGIATMHRLDDGKWTRCSIDSDKIKPAAVGDAPGELLVYAEKEEGKPKGLYRYDTFAGRLGDLLYHDEKYDISGARFYRHPVDGRVLGVQYSRKGPQSVWFDPKYSAIQEGVQAVFPGDVVRIIGSDKAEKQFFVNVSSDVRPSVYYRINLDTNEATLVANVAPWIEPKRMQSMRTIVYKARDGKEIEGYVTLPTGASKEKKVPLVVLAHGGPWARDNWQWNAETQFLASRGYAVFQPNYRGSTGYGWRFPEEDMWAFRKMHDDVTDGVRTVLRTGLIDHDRIAVMGGSFGGYLALCGAVYEKDLYRCAITVAGVFDWERMMKDVRGSEYMRSSFGTLRRRLGDPKKNQEKFDEISPARHVDQIRIPVFVAHGMEDVVALAGQSKRLIADLKKHGVPHEKQIEHSEGHGFRKLDNQVELYTAIEAFLAKHLAPRAKTVAAVSAAGGI